MKKNNLAERTYPKKEYGQHFLYNPSIAIHIAENIIAPIDIKNVLEVGPGKGILTLPLIDLQFNLKCIEIDDDMIQYLQGTLGSKCPSIIQGNVLKINFETLFDGEEFKLIGNYPYNISSQIVFQMIKYRHLIPVMVGMFQKEMADRILAPHGNKEYGVISVLTQAWYHGSKVMDIAPGSFQPPPKVQSTVIKLERKIDGIFPSDPALFRIVVKQSFSMRRKMLRNNLKPIVKDVDAISDSFFDHRAEQLTLAQFIELSEYLKDKIK